MKKLSVKIRKASPDNIPFIKECIENFHLDDEDLDYRQFIVAIEDKEIVGFGRIRPHKDVYELGCIGVVEHKRNQGIGEMIIKHLIDHFPTDDIYITTDLQEYFEKLGFKRSEPAPVELVEKLERICKTKCREGAVVMIYKKSKKN